ncbi:MAG: UTP--glucose-1-phosphate uridylyltransferase [Candidatus Cloacimonadota bacterium]|nr:UTP--glucose-1-phosphate uridylyltransferase [Candidatus Cloacimonadota bacterium]
MNYLHKFQDNMKKAKLNEVVIDSFSHYYKKILAGATGKLSESEISPPSNKNVISHQQLRPGNNAYLSELAVIKLNGGLGTSMGLKKAKSLIKVKNGLNFLDIIAKQILHLRQRSGYQIPLLFMNSFNTREDSLNHLKKYADLKTSGLPLDFLQNKFPKIKQADLSPLEEDDNSLNWNPPGHGEIYLVLKNTGMLEKLLHKGYKYAFISNSDNLGAVVDNSILSYMKSNNIPFVMEVCKRTPMDKKGGHLAETKDGNLVLREVAQCPENELDKFQNIKRYKYFNTNNIWIDLEILKQKLSENRNRLDLTLILNSKEVNGIPVFQVETAMGAAISIFENAKAVIISRNRFVPVKKTNDLLTLLSDAYNLSENFELKLTNSLHNSPNISLDPTFYKTIDQFYEHFLEIPSLKKCIELIVEGEVFFKENVSITGKVQINSKKSSEIKNINLENNSFVL